MMFGQFLKYLGLAGYPQSYASPTILAQSAVPSSVTGTTTETTLATVSVAGGVVATNGRIRIRTWWSFSNNADTKIVRVRLAASATLAMGTFSAAGASLAILDADALNVGSGQIFYVQEYLNGGTAIGVVGTTGGTVSLNLAQAQNLTFTGQLGTPSDTITLLGYSVETLNP